MGKKDKDRRDHKRRKRDVSPPPPRSLLTQAALGDKQACKDLLKRGANVNWVDGDLDTALHHACRHGHLSVVKTLLKKGAATEAQNLQGDTPAHLAARNSHLDVLAALLQSDHPPSIDLPNDKGWTVRQITAAAMDQQEDQAARERQRAAEEKKKASRHIEDEYDYVLDDDDEYGEDGHRSERWYQRLNDQLSDDDVPGVYYDEHWHTEEYETPEEYARRIWDEMQQRQRAQQAAETAAQDRVKRSEEGRKEWARRQAEENSKRILEEQRAADAAWRDAVASGAAGPKRAAYEARWEFFCTKHKDQPVGYNDVPWILSGLTSTSAIDAVQLKRVVLYGASSPEEQRQRLRTELMRWHPDKFAGKFGRRLVEGEKGIILDKVKEMSQALTEIHGQAQAAGK